MIHLIMKRKVEISIKRLIYILIWLHKSSPLQLTPTYWHHFKVPSSDNLCLSESQHLTLVKDVTLLECALECQTRSGGQCVAYNYYFNLKMCRIFAKSGTGFEIKTSCVYYQNIEQQSIDIANKAENKVVHSNGNCTDSYYSPASALADGSVISCACVSLTPGDQKWFVVDLGGNVEVYSVAVTTAVSLAQTANYFKIGVAKSFDLELWKASGMGPYILCAQYPQTVKSSVTYIVACQRNIGGTQFVALIQNVSMASFNICEVEVYGKQLI